MRKLAVLCLTFAACAAGSSAQSGRKPDLVLPVPSPTPVASSEDPAGYSESKPLRPRPAAPAAQPDTKEKKKHSREDKSKHNIQPTADADTDGPVLKVETDLITIPVSVYDRNGLYIPNLQRADFKIFEDGRQQDIAYFGTTDKPFTVVLLLDTSPSTSYKIDEIRRAAIAFVDQLKAEDQVMVVEFDSSPHVLTEPTGDRQKIYKAIGKADFGYGTSLYDAIDFSLRKRLNKIDGRKAIVLFTDGVDTTSHKAGYDTTLSMAEESDALIFPIYYDTFAGTADPPLFSGSSILSAVGSRIEDYALGKKYLAELADYTGGRIFRAETTPGGLTAAFEGIAEELRRQYNIGYIPAEIGTPGQRKQIRVRVDRPNLVVRARDSYIVGASRKPPEN